MRAQPKPRRSQKSSLAFALDGPGIVLSIVLIIVLFLIWTLSLVEKTLVAFWASIFCAYRWTNAPSLIRAQVEAYLATLVPDQRFSADAASIYKTRLVGQKFRLLRLSPGPADAKIACRLVEANLSNAPAYEAISYAWGPPTKRELIDCDGFDAQITQNLAQVLRKLRSTTIPRTLWVDDICINQQDAPEKSHQVERMGDIFKSAVRVIIWLGTDADKSVSQAMAVIEFVYDKLSNPGEDRNEDSHPTISNLEKLIEEEEGMHNVWLVLGRLFEREWFQRIWCVQEAFLAKDAIVMCGEDEIDGKLVGGFTRWLYDQDWVGEMKPNKTIEDGMKSAYRRLNKWSWSATFLETLDTFRVLQATDPRDKIYGLVGLNDLSRKVNKLTPQVSVDYGKSLSEVLFDAAIYAIRSEGSLRFLSYINHRTPLSARGEYPSWVVRWDMAQEPQQDHLWCESSSISAGQRRLDFASPTSYSPTITFKGSILDSTVASVSPLCTAYRHGPGDDLGTWILQHLLWISEQSKQDTANYHRFMARLATTLTGGHVKKDGPAASSVYFEHLEADVGRQYQADFYAFVAVHFPTYTLRRREDLRRYVGNSTDFWPLVGAYAIGRRLFTTVEGYIGLGPGSMADEDVVAVLDGGKVPYVLRRAGEGEFEFVGECFMYEVMDRRRLDAAGMYEGREVGLVLR